MAIIESEQIHVYRGVLDLRKGANGLRALVGETEPEVFSVFSNRTRELLKFLSVDETSVWCGARDCTTGGLRGHRVRMEKSS